jgi:DsbC/DsbD-like thiol-disulfide interchange protein
MPAHRPTDLLVATLLAALVLTIPAGPAFAQFGFDTLEPADGDKVVTMEIVTANDTIVPGATEFVGIRLRIQPGWHIYWRNPGDSGSAPRVRAKTPAALTVGEIVWPRPVIFEDHGETTYGYADDVTLLLPITAGNDLPPGPVTIPIEADWLVCKRACLLGEATGEINLTVPHPGDNGLRARGNRLAEAMKRLPTPISKMTDMSVTLLEGSSAGTRRLVVTGSTGDAERIRFIPDLTPGVTTDDGHPVDATIEDGRFRIEVPLRVEPDNALDQRLEAAGLVLFGPAATDRAVSFRIPVTN